MVATWHNGSSAMIGKSYDGTLANGVAATGVEGLKTIVPVSAISAWYNYSRTGGVRHNTNYPAGLNGNVTTAGGPNEQPPGVNLPQRRTSSRRPTRRERGSMSCTERTLISDDTACAGDGDAHGDINQFWRDRDYVKDASKVKAAVFATHGLQDDNVRMDHMGMWWEALKANNVPRKLWLLRAGHEDPFESRRTEWVDTLHRWFDHYLYGVANGIQNRARRDDREREGRLGQLRRLADPGHAERRRLPALDRRRHGGQPRRAGRERRRDADARPSPPRP